MAPRVFKLNRSSPQAQGLVGWWPMYHHFNAQQNNHLVNMAPHGVKSPIINAGTPVYGFDDVFGTTTSFVNANDLDLTGYFQPPITPASEVTTGAFALSCWIKITTAGGTIAQGIICKEAVASPVNYIEFAYDPTSDTVTFNVGDGTHTQNATTATALAASGSGWRHLMAVRGGGRHRLFLDGKSQTNVADVCTLDLGLGAVPWTLLAWAQPAEGSSCPQQIADLRIYNLTAYTETTAGAFVGKLAQHMYNPATRFDLCLTPEMERARENEGDAIGRVMDCGMMS